MGVYKHLEWNRRGVPGPSQPHPTMVAITVAHTMRNVESSVVTSEPRVRIAVREDGMDNLARELKNRNDVE